MSATTRQPGGKAPQPAPTPQPLLPDEAREMAEEVYQLTNRTTEGLQERNLPNGGRALDLQGRFQNVPLAKRNEDGSTAVECVDNLASASNFLGLNPAITKQVAQTRPSAPAEFRAENQREGKYAYAKKLTPTAATIVIVNNNAAGVGFNDTTPVAPVGGNTGTTLGQQRLIAFQAAASIWGATLDSNVTIVIRSQFTALTCTATTATLVHEKLSFLAFTLRPSGTVEFRQVVYGLQARSRNRASQRDG